MRILKCSEVLDIRKFMKIYKKFSKDRVDRIILNDPTQAEDIDTDVVHITIQIMIGKIFQIIKLAIIILHICYFLGFAWFIICMVSKDLTNDYQSSLSEEDYEKDNTDNFLDYYFISENTDYYNCILGTYFAFTTLSTVGFGDIAPRSDPERFICAFVLMIGVSVFSVFLGNFTAIIDAYKAINSDLDDSDKLDSFFEMMMHFNANVPFDLDFR